MKTPFILPITICLSLFFISDSFGKMYKRVDENSQTHFSDKPPEGPKAETLKGYETFEEKSHSQRQFQYTPSTPLSIESWKWDSIDSINGTCIEREVRNNSLAASGRGKIIISPLISIPASAEVYKCMDADGQITFSTKPGHECALLPGSVEKKPHPLKPPASKPSRSATKPVDKTRKYQSPRCTTKDGYFACLEEKWLDHMTKFIIAEDYESINAYVSSKKCLSIKGGLTVTILESLGMSGGKTSFIYKGIKYWTYRKAINFK